MSTDRQLCTFTLDGQLFGIDVQRVQEVLRYQPLTRVPLAPNVITGLMNLRGQIATAIDLRRRLGLAERAPEARPMNVVVRTDDGAVSLLVDEIGEVTDVTADAFEPPPGTVSSSVRGLIEGAYKLKDRLLLVLNLTAALELMPAETR